MIQQFFALGTVVLMISYMFFSVHRVCERTLRHHTQFKLESLDIRCSALRAARKNIDVAASILKARFADRIEDVEGRRSELLTAITSRVEAGGCLKRKSRYEVYFQQNPDLPEQWPNWWIKPVYHR